MRFLHEQLCEFYGPMLALRAEVLAKSEVRLKIGDAAHGAWLRIFEDLGEADLRMIDVDFSPFERIIEEDNRKLAEEIIPAYQKMVQCFLAKIHLSEVSTIEHLEQLVAFVDIWQRQLSGTLPAQVVERLGNSEKKLYPFYRDLTSHFLRLQDQLKENRSWWSWRKPAKTIKVIPLQ